MLKMCHEEMDGRKAVGIEIPKANGKTRPLKIYCYENKLVQDALRKILKAVFEPHFYNEDVFFQ